jgi:hypothetical protein
MKFLKSIQARDLTNIGGALQRIFSFLHVQRLALDIDRFGKLTLSVAFFWEQPREKVDIVHTCTATMDQGIRVLTEVSEGVLSTLFFARGIDKWLRLLVPPGTVKMWQYKAIFI